MKTNFFLRGAICLLIGMLIILSLPQDSKSNFTTSALIVEAVSAEQDNDVADLDDRLLPTTLITKSDTQTNYLPLLLKNECISPFIDQFDNSQSGWPINIVGDTRYHYLPAESHYHIYHEYRYEWMGVTRGDRLELGESFRVRSKITAGKASLSLVFGINDSWTDFYTFELYPVEKLWAIFHFNAQTGWDRRGIGSVIVNNPDDYFTLEIRDRNSYDLISFYIDGYLYASIKRKPGRIGIAAGSLGVRADVWFDYYSYAEMGCPRSTVPEENRATISSIRLKRPFPVDK